MRQNHTRPNKSSKPSKKDAVESLLVQPRRARAKPKPVPGEIQRAVGSRVNIAPGLNSAAEISAARSRLRYDRPGHLEDAHADRLRHLSQRRAGRDEFAMVFDAVDGDELATELAEQAVTSMVGGGDTWLDTVNAQVDEEEGGPFLETRASKEFASGPESEDETAGFLREALPTPSAGNSVPFEGVRRGRRP